MFKSGVFTVEPISMKNDRIPGENTENILKSKFPSRFRLVRIIIYYIHRVLLQLNLLGDLHQKVRIKTIFLSVMQLFILS